VGQVALLCVVQPRQPGAVGREPRDQAPSPATTARNGQDGRVPPDREVPEHPQRCRFTAECKLRILKEAEARSEPGEIGLLLRREGLYSSHLVDWRQQRDAGAFEALVKRRGRAARIRRTGRSPACAATTTGSVGGWARPRRSSRCREQSPSCWGSRSTRRATTKRARADGGGRGGGPGGGGHLRRPGGGPLAGNGVLHTRPPSPGSGVRDPAEGPPHPGPGPCPSPSRPRSPRCCTPSASSALSRPRCWPASCQRAAG
jgi:hypothetical protein